MKVVAFEDRADWDAYRIGKIGGSRLGDIMPKRGTGKKMAFYELIAERLGIPGEEEVPMDRGTRLEPEALQEFEKQTGKVVDKSLKIWVSDLNPSITCSPDGIIDDGVEACEVKCLSSARHIQAIIENEIPDDYMPQIKQYFVTNEKLQKLYFIMYDPRIVARPMIVFEFNRADLEEQIQTALAFELQTLNEVDEWVAKLTNY